MRLVAIAAAATLTGCSAVKGWFGSDDEKPQPEVPVATTPGALSTVGEKLDKADSRVAAAVSVAVENKDNPKVVEAEGKVALAYLPTPSADDLTFARARAKNASEAEYASQIAYAREFTAKLEAEWKRAEQQAKKNSDDLAGSLTRVNQLTAEVAKVRKEAEENLRRVEAEASRNIWTLTGAAMAVIGAVASAFLGLRVGGVVLLCGAFCGAMPFVYGSPYFGWIAGVTLALACGLGIWRLWDYVKDKNDEKAS